jgi:hypothetical protein
MVGAFKQLEISSQEQVVLKLAGRTHGDVKNMGEFSG